MKISELIKTLQGHQQQHGDLEVKQLMGLYTKEGEYLAEGIVPIKKVKYNKKKGYVYIDFV